MSEDELKLTRRLFLQHSAVATAMSAAAYSIAMKTDALARADDGLPNNTTKSWPPEEMLPYLYHEGSQ